jgi:hypothetical protein
VGINDEFDIPLTDDEREVLRSGLGEWAGPAHCTREMAVAMGFESEDDLLRQADRIREALRQKQPLTQQDWTRTLLATEIAFASDALGSGHDWSITTGFSDAETLALLRSIQRKVPAGGFQP